MVDNGLAPPDQGRIAAARAKSGRPGGKYDIFISDRDALAFFISDRDAPGFFLRGPGRAGPQRVSPYNVTFNYPNVTFNYWRDV